MRDLSTIGSLGVLSVATRGSSGAGEVVISVRGATESLLAWSDEALPKGAEVVVLDVLGPRTVHVGRADELGIVRGLS